MNYPQYFAYYLKKEGPPQWNVPNADGFFAVQIAAFDGIGRRSILWTFTRTLYPFNYGQLVRVVVTSYGDLRPGAHVDLYGVPFLRERFEMTQEIARAEGGIVYTLFDVEIKKNAMASPGIFYQKNIGLMRDPQGFLKSGSFTFLVVEIVPNLELSTFEIIVTNALKIN